MSYITQEQIRINKISSSLCVRMLKEIFTLLNFIHSQGVIHRDIKPENILLNVGEDGEDLQLVICDFGISWYGENNGGIEPFQNKICDVSTGIYKLPELIFSYKKYTNAIDIWSCGVILTELYSNNCESILNDQFHGGDISLLSSILDTFGTDNLQKWIEIQDVDSFQKLNFIAKTPKPVDDILPRCNELWLKEMFVEMMQYESSLRPTALEILKSFKI